MFVSSYSTHYVYIRIDVLLTEQYSINEMRSRANFANPRTQLIINENGTQSLLDPSFMYRVYLFPVHNRGIRSDIHIDNTIIRLTEQRDRRELDQNVSSEFIRLLYELLTAEE